MWKMPLNFSFLDHLQDSLQDFRRSCRYFTNLPEFGDELKQIWKNNASEFVRAIIHSSEVLFARGPAIFCDVAWSFKNMAALRKSRTVEQGSREVKGPGHRPQRGP